MRLLTKNDVVHPSDYKVINEILQRTQICKFNWNMYEVPE